MEVVSNKTIYKIEIEGSELRLIYKLIHNKLDSENLGLYDKDPLCQIAREIMMQFDDLTEELMNYQD